MPLYDWSKRFLLGIPEIDKHHKYLVWILNKTYDEFMGDASPVYLGVLIDEIVDYSRYHFAAEERWMSIDGYPKRTEHTLEHEFFTTRVTDLQRNYKAGTPVLSAELFSFLMEWVKNHILGTDREYGQWLAEERDAL